MRVLDTPVGLIGIDGSDAGVNAVHYLTAPQPDTPGCGPVDEAADQLTQYFAGARHAFTVEVVLDELSLFARQVLRACAAIPAGETRSYGEIAQELGQPGATRAVGSALRRNPVPVLIPCHRVIRADGQLGRYAGAEDDRKQTLLALDRS